MHPLADRSLRTHVAALPDPRVDRAKRHEVLDVVTIAICEVLGGADSWVGVEVFGRSKEGWLRTFLALPYGIPAHDTFGRIFAAPDPAAVQRCFLGRVQAVAGPAEQPGPAIDGKTSRRSHDRPSGRGPLHRVSASATRQGLVLGQVATDAHSNEITAVPALLETLMLEGNVVTIDAMGCQSAIAEQIVARGGDDVLALKDNQPALHEVVAHHFTVAAEDAAGLIQDDDTSTGKDHGRLEVRRCWATDDPAVLEWLDPERTWPGLGSIACIEGERRSEGMVSRQRRDYLSSLPADAARIAAAVRAHWGIENRLHWVLDVAFREDECRVRTGHAAENFAVLRHIALNLLRQEQSLKVGVKAKRLTCGWDDAYLLKVLAP